MPDQFMEDYMRDTVAGLVAENKRLETEIGRLRAIVRVNCIRWGGTDAEVDRLLAVSNGTRGTEA